MNRKLLVIITVLVLTGLAIVVALLANRGGLEITKLSPSKTNSLTLNSSAGVIYFEDENNTIASYSLETNSKQSLLPYDESPYSISTSGTYIARQNNGKSFDLFDQDGEKVESIDALSLAWVADDKYVYFNPINPSPEGNNTGLVAEKTVGASDQRPAGNHLANNLFGFNNQNIGVVIENELEETPATNLITPLGNEIFRNDTFWIDYIHPVYPQNNVLGVEASPDSDVGKLSILNEDGTVVDTGFVGSLSMTALLPDNKLLFAQHTNSRTYFKTYDLTSQKTHDLFDLPQISTIYTIRGYENQVIINSDDGVMVIKY